MSNLSTASQKFYNPLVIVIPDDALPIKPNTTPPRLISHKKIKAKFYFADIDQSKPVDLKDLGSQLIELKGDMHVRGDATADMNKQQFSVKLKHEPSAGNFLGMPGKGKHWVFNDCDAVDFTMLRNVLAFSMQKELGMYAPAFKFFELYLCENTASISNLADIISNNYYGVYLNFDKIRFQKDRLDYPYDKDNITTDYAIIQANQSSSKYLCFENRPPLTGNVEVYEPELDKLDSAQQSDFNTWYYDGGINGWAGNFANAFNNYANLNKPIPSSLFTSIKSTTDYDSFAKYFLLNEIAKDPDGYHKSTFMIKDKSVVYAGPLWDKNKSYGNIATRGASDPYVNPEGWLFSMTGQVPVWWYILPKDTEFCKKVWSVWNANNGYAKAFNYQWADTLITNNVTYLTGTNMRQREAARWPVGSFNTNSSQYDKQISQLKDTYLKVRLSWIDNNLKAMLKEQSGFVPPA